jgi:hypothetical protein
MNTYRRITLSITLILALAPWTLSAGNIATLSRCTLDQQMWINGGGDGFGGPNVLGQTFRPTAPGLVCKIELMIHKNNPAASDLVVVLRRSDFSPIANGTVTIPAAEIPLGLSVQTLDFCCNQMPLLAGSPFYGLTLASPGGWAPDYTWINSDDAGADAAYLRGNGYVNVHGAAPGTAWAPVGYDYAFKIYICRP